MAINNLQIMNTGRSELWIRRGDLPHCACLFPSRSPRGLATLRVPFVICNILMAVFSQSYFPVLFGDLILPRSSSFNFFI